MCLDASNARKAMTSTEAYGVDPAQRLFQVNGKTVLALDNSNCVRNVEDNSEDHYLYQRLHAPQDEPQVGHMPSPVQDEASEADEDESPLVHVNQSPSTIDLDGDSADEDDEEIEQDSAEELSDDESIPDISSPAIPQSGVEHPFTSGIPSGTGEITVSVPNAPHVSVTVPISVPAHPTLTTNFPNYGEPYASKRDKVSRIPLLRYLDFHLLCTGETEISLLYNVSLAIDNHDKSPRFQSVVCQQALEQRTPSCLSSLRKIERLNMTHEIPELGLVIIGNQIGRVAILTMTRIAPALQNAHANMDWSPDFHPGFRIEAIVPFRSQESSGLRPEKPLLGFAVSPIQGHQPARPGLATYNSKELNTIAGLNIARELRRPDRPTDHSRDHLVPEARRWRLIIMYYDLTTLSYEISRPRAEEPTIVI